MRVTLQQWSPDDMPVLERCNTSDMTAQLGGPESPEELQQRHDRYLRLWEAGLAHMFRIDVDGAPAGSIGWWQVDHDGVPAYETGWCVYPELQGKGVATEALRQVIRRVAALGDRHLLVAYPGVDNGPSNALCRRAMARRPAHLQHLDARPVTPRPRGPGARRALFGRHPGRIAEEETSRHGGAASPKPEAALGSARPAMRCRAQNRPTMWPSSSTSMLRAAGTAGRPGIVMMSPQTMTMKRAPAARRTSRISTACPVGAPRSLGSVENEYCVFATHTGYAP